VTLGVVGVYMRNNQNVHSEQQSLERLREAVPKELWDEVDTLGISFQRLRYTEDIVARSSPIELYESMWAILGMISRTYQLLLCCVDQLAAKNWNGFYACGRGLAETLCALVWANENPERLPTLVQTDGPSIGKIVNAGYRRYPDLRHTYARLSAIVHPRRDSHLLAFTSLDSRHRAPWSAFGLDFSNHFAAEKLAILLEISHSINLEIERLVSSSAMVTRRGKVVARVMSAAADS
jgi:hypothetical protein